VALQAEIESLTESITVREKEFDETATAFVAAKGKPKAVLLRCSNGVAR